MYVYLNNELVDDSKAFISIKNSSFLYGEAIFDTMRVTKYKIINKSRYKARLMEGIKILGYKLDLDKLLNLAEKLSEINGISSGLVKVHISSNNISSEKDNLNILISNRELSVNPMNASLYLSSYRKPPIETIPNLFKTCNYLTNNLAKKEATHAGFSDALMLSSENFISESAYANIFWSKDNQLFTPALETGCLQGTTRGCIIDNLEIQIGFYTISQIIDADFVFLTNSNFIALPVAKINNTIFKEIYFSSILQLKAKILDIIEKEP